MSLAAVIDAVLRDAEYLTQAEALRVVRQRLRELRAYHDADDGRQWVARIRRLEIEERNREARLDALAGAITRRLRNGGTN